MSTENDRRDYDRDDNEYGRDSDTRRNQGDSSNSSNRYGQNPGRDQSDDFGDTEGSSNDFGNRGRSSDVQNSGRSSDDVESRWNDIESDYRRRYPNITDDDVNYRQGEFDTMTDRIAKRTNRSREAVNDEIRNWNS